MSVGVRWVSVVIANPREQAAALERLWVVFTGHEVTRRTGERDELAPLTPRDGHPHLWFQRLGSGRRHRPSGRAVPASTVVLRDGLTGGPT
jgi:hypothetical protein